MFILAAAPCPVAFAASPQLYARAKNEEAYFYSEDRTKSLFAVPETYCVEVLSEDGEWYRVRYADNVGIYKELKGYCKKKDFTLEDGKPPVTYLYKTVTVTYKSEVTNSPQPTLPEIAFEAAYYGYYRVGGDFYSYVYCQGSFGYINGKNDDYEPNAPAFANGGGTEGGGTESGSNLNFASIAFIVIASLSVVVILVIYFTTKKPRIDG